MDDKNLRQTTNQCTLGAQTGPQTIIVRQIIGEVERQKVLDIHVVVPDRKPAIEQIVDVFVKEVEINSVDIITDKVIVRGEFEIKAIYVAALPDQPVHAVEIKHYKWTQDVDLPGARKGMDADASVVVEFVDYDIEEHTRAYKYKNFEVCCDDEEEAENVESETETESETECDEKGHHHHHHHDCREFDVSVVLKIIAKVMADREVQIGSVTTPTTPKG
ncbi:MAG: DUF3794 domain-containing protein [Pelosinus sp.]|nr:DUF3794 domain-containing protein [Pelosinus sp.]